MADTETKRPTFQKSNDTSILEHVLRESIEGQTVTYEELSNALGRDVRKFSSGCLRSARRILEREGIHTAAVPNEGIKRLEPHECLDQASSHVTRARKAACRGRHTVETTPFDRLSDADRSRAFALSAQSTAIESFGSRQATKKLTNKAAESQSAIPLGETLKLFGGGD